MPISALGRVSIKVLLIERRVRRRFIQPIPDVVPALLKERDWVWVRHARSVRAHPLSSA
jgi:hypothetical protein